MYKIATLSSGGNAGVRAGEGLHAPTSTPSWRASRRRPRSSSSPTPTIPPAPTFPTTRCAACTRACPATCCWCSMRPTREYVRRNDYEAGLELVATTDNTVMTRTFSKIYGLAALRLGWAYCPAAVADVLEPRARALQRHRAGDRRRRGGARRPRARRDGRRAQREMAALGDGRDREAGPRGDAERRQFRAHPFPDAEGHATPPRPTSS